MNGSATSALANGTTSVAYLAICLAISVGLWRSGQWRNNLLGLATAAIFFTCAIGHGTHVLHNLYADSPTGRTGHAAHGGPGSAAGTALLDLGFLTTGWDVLTATVAIWYWTLRGRFPALVRGAAVFEDLRLREATQQTLRESEERYREIVETTTDGVVLLGTDGDVTYCNAQFTAIVGQFRPGLPFIDLVADVDRGEIQCALESVRSGTPRRIEVGLRHAEARSVCAQVTLTARTGPTGARDGTLAIVTDVTEQKNIEAQLRQAQRLDALGQLAGGIAHDFNNLLTVIDGYATLVLARDNLDEGVAGDLTAVRDAAARATGLTSQLLAFSRTSDVRPGPVDLNDLVRGLEGMLRRLIREDIELVVITHPRAATARIDRGKLEQVLVNLVVNSRDAMPRGGRLFIRVDLVDHSAPDPAFAARRPTLTRPFVRLTVADSGHGMTDDVRARIFEPFFTTKAPGQGTGLGLATVYGIVRQAEGAVEVDSVPGLGATFRVELPALIRPSPDEPDEPDEQPARPATDQSPQASAGEPTSVPISAPAPVLAAGAVAATTAAPTTTTEPPAATATTAATAAATGQRRGRTGQSATILLAEDDDAVRSLAERVLRAAGHQVICAADGRAAIDLARGLTSIDLLVTDVILPGRNGRQLAEELTRLFPGLPVVFTSAYSRGMLDDNGGALTFAYLPKPFTPADLTEAIRAALTTRRPCGHGPAPSRDPSPHPGAGHSHWDGPPRVSATAAARHREARPRGTPEHLFRPDDVILTASSHTSTEHRSHPSARDPGEKMTE